MTRVLVAAVALAAATSAAAEPQPGSRSSGGPDALSVTVVGGLAPRTATQTEGGATVTLQGPGAGHAHLLASWYFWKFLGATVDGLYEGLTVAGSDAVGGTSRVSLQGFRAQLGLAGRWAPIRALSLQLQLGYGLGQVPAVVGFDGRARAAPLFSHAPWAGLGLSWHPDLPVAVELRGKVAPWAAGASGGGAVGLQVGAYSGLLQVSVPRLDVGPVTLAPTAEYELAYVAARGSLARAPQVPWTHRQLAHRFGLGLKVALAAPPVGTAVEPPKPATVRVAVRTAEGAPVAQAAVTVDGAAAGATDALGELRLGPRPAGPLQVAATAQGFKPASASADAKPGAEALVVLTLAKPTGPGTLKGSVRTAEPDAPAGGATVSAGGKQAVVGEDGSWTLAGVGPGAVAVTVTHVGYEAADEVVQVPPEAEAVLDVTLSHKKPNATLRGQVGARGGGKVQAVVRIVETGAKIVVGADGRFSVELPGGRYRLVVEAPGFLSQTRTIEVGYGDQTIYHFELRPQ